MTADALSRLPSISLIVVTAGRKRNVMTMTMLSRQVVVAIIGKISIRKY
jgi:hypothetical protein